MRVGTLPDTAPWRRVVELIAEGAEVSKVANATTEAALKGLNRAVYDSGIAESFFQLTRLVLSARQPDFPQALRDIGQAVGDKPDLFEITGSYSESVDIRLRRRARTDIAEMAHLAGVESLTAQLGQKVKNLFETTPAEVRSATRELSTKAGFASLAHQFFTCFSRRFLTYHLGRELGLHVGGNGVFDDTRSHDRFVEHLTVHCREAAEITHRYGGDWYSKQNFEGGITLEKTRRFVSHCMRKLRGELLLRGARDG